MSSPSNGMVAVGVLASVTLKSNFNRKENMFILKSILNQAGAVWQVESIALRKKEAECLFRRRQAQSDGSRRYGLFPAK